MPVKKTSQSALGSSAAVEDYLERILELINTKGYARVVDIAAALKISQASVTNMVQRLDAEGLLKYEKYRGLILTAAGKTLARKIAHRHKLLTDFSGSSASMNASFITTWREWSITSAVQRLGRYRLSPNNFGDARRWWLKWNPPSPSRSRRLVAKS